MSFPLCLSLCVVPFSVAMPVSRANLMSIDSSRLKLIFQPCAQGTCAFMHNRVAVIIEEDDNAYFMMHYNNFCTILRRRGRAKIEKWGQLFLTPLF